MKKEKKINIKNIALIFIMFILVTLGINNISDAKSWGRTIPSISSISKGDTFSLSFTEYNAYINKLLCIQEGRKLRTGVYKTYTVQAIISIKGDSANGVEATGSVDGWNARLAYVLHNTSGEARRRAMWYYFPKWVDKIGSKIGINRSWKNDGNKGLAGVPSTEQINKYVNKVKDGVDSKDAYIKQKKASAEPSAKLPTGTAVIDDKGNTRRDKYIKVGPFKYSFYPKLNSMTIEGHNINGKSIKLSSDKDDIQFVSDGKVYKDISKLKSDEEFSILIPNDVQMAKITHISLATKFSNNDTELISAKIAILKTGTGSEAYQNLAIVETSKENMMPTNASIEIDLNLPTTIDIIIEKVNSQNKSQKLPGVGFKLKNVQLGLWVVEKSDGTIKYVADKSKATTFKTGSMPRASSYGRVTIDGLLLGDYKFVETIQPNFGFECATKEFTLSSNSGTIKVQHVVKQIKNNPIDGGMKIVKVDMKNPEIKIPGVRFKLRNTSLSGNQWVKKNFATGEITYVDQKNATEFETDENGEASVNKLLAGEYEFYETYTPPTYKCENQYFTVKEEDVKSTEIIPYTIKNEPINGGILITKVDEENPSITIPNVKFKLVNRSLKENQYVHQDEVSKEITYVNEENATIFCTDQYGKAKINKLLLGEYEFKEIEVPEGYECTSKYFTITAEQAEKQETETIPYTITNKKKEEESGNVLIEKVDENNQRIKLANVGFKLRYIKDNKWVSQSESGEITYIENETSATTFFTDKDGQKRIDNLLVGEYEFKEVVQPNYGYECISKNFTIIKDETTKLQFTLITNKQIYIKLSGRVWIDKHSGKQNLRNDLYMTNYNYNGSEYVDDSDTPVPGLTVKLMKDGVVQKTTITDSNGTYIFDNVSVDQLSNYYIEFEYNGLIYTNVTPHLDNNNGSKAIEGNATRNEFNKNFEYIENGGSQTAGVTKNSAKEIKHNIEYNINSDEHKATLADKYKDINSEEIRITANTKETEYNLYTQYINQKNNSTTPIECIEHNNLGIYEREQPDIALVKDIQNVKLAINGYEHIYEYAQRFVNQGVYGDGYDVGVKFGAKYGAKYGQMKYTRPIYKSDYMWQNPENTDKELQVYITYKIQIRNQSTNLKTRVNSIVDYYDSSYEEIKGVGRTLSGNGTVGSLLAIDYNAGYGEGYNKMIIDTSDVTLDPQTTQDIYVQFRLNRQKVNDIIGNGEILDNVVEINSYSTFYNEEKKRIYAGIDKNSAPGNAIPGSTNTDTYEDDTDTAPTLKLEISDNARQISGTVFLDKTDDGLLTAQIREGNGQYGPEDKPIEGVQVKLVEDSGKEYYIGENVGTGNTTNISNSKTDENGNFTISGFIPGNYKIVYTWGKDLGGYDVQDYKGTVYDEERYNSINTENSKSENLEGGSTNTTVYKWYKNDEKEGKRYTDAIDDYDTRLEIDKELKTKTYSSDSTTPVHFDKTMDSTTQTMKIAVEYDDESFASKDHSVAYKYEINYIDFGIVRRAKQSVELDKRVKSMRVVLANGQVVSEVTVEEDENGNRTLTGEKNHVTYMGPLNTSPGFIKVELDNELIQGAKIEVTYEFKFKNRSEVDLINKTYYTFGSKSMPQAKTTESNYELKYNGTTKGWAKLEEVVKVKANEIIDYLDRDWGYEADKNSNWTPIAKEDFETNYINKGLVSKEILDNENSAINDRVILYNKEWNNAPLVEPGKEATPITLVVSKTLTTTDDISLENETEIIELTKGSKIPDKPVDPNDITPGGATIIQTPGNYVPGSSPVEPDTDRSETVIVTPSTGANLEFGIPIIIGLVALVILGTGIILIKKKVIDSK